MKHAEVTAIVTLQVKMKLSGGWPGDATVIQLHKQAYDAVKRNLEKIANRINGKNPDKDLDDLTVQIAKIDDKLSIVVWDR